MSPAPARSFPRSRPCSLSVCWGTRLTADPMSSRALCCACPCQPGGRHGPGGTHADGGAVSQQSVTGATPSAQLVSLLAPDTAAFLTVFSLLVQHCQQEAASTKLVSPKFQSPLLSLLSQLMDVKTSSGFRPVAVANLQVSSDHWLADPGWLAGQRSSASPSWASSSSPPSSQGRTVWRTSSSRGRPWSPP